MNAHLQNLRELLAEDVSSVQMRERTTFDRQAGPFSHSLVLFGSGKLGRSILRGLRGLGIEPLAFCDNNPGLWNQSVDGLQVFSPADAVWAFGDKAVFVVTIWSDVIGHPLAEVTRQLQSHGPARVVSFIPLYWKHPGTFLPYFSLDLPHKIILQKESVLQAAQLWGDERSQQEYAGQLRWRLRLDFSGVTPPCLHNPFFQPDLISENSNEVFVDCGAYDGDTLRVILKRGIGRFKRIIALEPDPFNYAKLRACIESLEPEARRGSPAFLSLWALPVEHCVSPAWGPSNPKLLIPVRWKSSAPRWTSCWRIPHPPISKWISKAPNPARSKEHAPSSKKTCPFSPSPPIMSRTTSGSFLC